MKLKFKKNIIRFLLFIFLYLLGVVLFSGVDCSFISSDFNWAARESCIKDLNYKDFLDDFQNYKIEVGNKNLFLYRTTKRRWFNIFNWIDYCLNEKWDLPYREIDDDYLYKNK